MERFKRAGLALSGLLIISAVSVSPAHAAAKGEAVNTEEGKALFTQNCAVCHQADAIGKPGFAPSLTNKELLSISKLTIPISDHS